MKRIGFVLVILMFAATSWAAPFVVSDPAPAEDGIINYKIYIDGGVAIDSVPVAGAIRYDLSGLPAGSHTIKAKACNVWDCSGDSLPLDLIKKVPGAPGVLRIVP